MSLPSRIKTLTMDGRDIGARAEETILEVARENGMDLDLRAAPLDGSHTLYPLVRGILVSHCTTRACSGAAASTRLGLVPAARHAV
jgi:predicted molibdopterin-dependent oxidoreductase YjgC